MWNLDVNYKDKTGTGIGGGGFDVSGYGSPESGAPADTSKTNKGPQSICPVTIRQILESPEDNLTVAGNAVTMMTVVGIIKSVEITSTKIIYTIQDWTGIITGLQWLEGDMDESSTPRVVEDTYYKMAGTKRMQEGKVCLLVYHMAPIENMMEITHHFLQVIYVPLKSEQLKNDVVDAPPPYMKMQMSASYGDDAFGSSSTSYSNINLTPQQMRVYRVLQQCTNESGINSKGIQDLMQVKMAVHEIEKALEYLVSEGHIYNTIDDYHFRATDLVS